MVGLKSNDWGPGRKRREQRHRKEGNVNIGRDWSGPAKREGPPEAGTGTEGFCPRALRRSTALLTF